MRIPIRIVLCGLLACSSACSDSEKPDAPTEKVTQNLEPNFQAERGERFSFDVFEDHVTATLLSLGDVKIQMDGTAVIYPTLSHTPTGDVASGDWRYELSPPFVGRADNFEQIPVWSSVLKQSTMTHNYGRWAVDYIHKPEGLEQIVRVNNRPAGDENLVVKFAVPTGFELLNNTDGDIEVRHNNEPVVVWSKLSVFDANGDHLVAKMYAKNNALTYEVEDAGATYPITIDPLAQSPSFTELGDQAEGEVGRNKVIGDVNNDGFDDLLVGQRRYTNGESREGRALIFPGSAQGLSATAIWSVEGGQAAANFGNELTRIGDINNDNFDDFAVGATNANGTAVFAGGGYVFLGGVVPQTTAVYSQFGDQIGEGFGDTMAAGDFNCDGFTDLAFGAAPWDSNAAVDNGRVVIVDGIAASPFFDSNSLTAIERDDLGKFYGRSLSAGNINGDQLNGNDCDDLIVGGARYSVGLIRRGRVDAFFGSATGIDPTTIDWTVLGAVTEQNLGFSTDVSDFNNDGNADILVGGYGNELADGIAHLFLGGANPSTTPIWSAQIGQQTANFGVSVAFAGDVDNNGFQDILVGAPEYVFSGGVRVGAAFLYASAGNVPPTVASWTETEGNQATQEFGFEVSGGGDFNNDGFDDISIGSRLRNNGQITSAGAVYAYYGRPSCSVGGSTYDDGEPNPLNPCEICDVSVSTTMFTPVANGGVCNDNDSCTNNDTCNNGTCSGTTVVCNDNEVCTIDSCDSVLGCVFDPNPANGSTCTSDGLTCTNDVCNAGTCTHPIDANSCLVGGDCFAPGDAEPLTPCEQCDPGTSQTAFSPAGIGAACSDGQFCTENDTCDGGGTCSGAARDCSGALTECTTNTICDDVNDICVASDPVVDGTACGAGDLCATGACSFGICVPDAPVDCSAFDGLCMIGTCDPNDGTCSAQPAPNGDPCDDGDACTMMTTCSAGACSGAAVDCNDNNDCTVDSCNSANGCLNAPASDGTMCSDMDGLACTTGTCSAAACVGVAVVAGSCLIQGACFADGQTETNNVCRFCDSATDDTDWTNATPGTSCGADQCLGEQLAVATCAAGGGCTATFTDCGAYTCDAANDSCFTSCLTVAQCEAGASCTSDGITSGVCITEKPAAAINGPVIAACGEMVTLDGSSSTDPNNLPLTYSWTQIEGPDVLTGVDTSMEMLQITVPAELLMDTTFRFRLVVSNGAFDSDASEWILSVEACAPGGDDMGTADMDTGFDFGTDMTVDSSNNDAGVDANVDTGADTTTDVRNDVNQTNGIVKGSGCLCASTESYPTDASWLLLLGLLGFARRRRK